MSSVLRSAYDERRAVQDAKRVVLSESRDGWPAVFEFVKTPDAEVGEAPWVRGVEKWQ